MRLITFENSRDNNDYINTITQMRDTFATVFSKHYTQLIQSTYQNNDFPTQLGFRDLILKCISNGKNPQDAAEMQAFLQALYAGPGFDDEASFLLWFRQCPLNESQKADVAEYTTLMQQDGRTLQEINFIALLDEKNTMRGFLIYHVFIKDNKTILHVRQAAMREKNRGYARIMARYLVDHYPHAFYEANQRWGNRVYMKELLLQSKIMEKTNPVLGYGNKYIGLRTHYSLLAASIAHYGLDKIALKRNSLFWEAESIQPLFSAMTLAKESMRDDNFTHCPHHYISKMKL